jgi:hypothetical protein
VNERTTRHATYALQTHQRMETEHDASSCDSYIATRRRIDNVDVAGHSFELDRALLRRLATELHGRSQSAFADLVQ